MLDKKKFFLVVFFAFSLFILELNAPIAQEPFSQTALKDALDLNSELNNGLASDNDNLFCKGRYIYDASGATIKDSLGEPFLYDTDNECQQSIKD